MDRYLLKLDEVESSIIGVQYRLEDFLREFARLEEAILLIKSCMDVLSATIAKNKLNYSQDLSLELSNLRRDIVILVELAEAEIEMLAGSVGVLADSVRQDIQDIITIGANLPEQKSIECRSKALSSTLHEFDNICGLIALKSSAQLLIAGQLKSIF